MNGTKNIHVNTINYGADSITAFYSGLLPLTLYKSCMNCCSSYCQCLGSELTNWCLFSFYPNCLCNMLCDICNLLKINWKFNECLGMESSRQICLLWFLLAVSPFSICVHPGLCYTFALPFSALILMQGHTDTHAQTLAGPNPEEQEQCTRQRLQMCLDQGSSLTLWCLTWLAFRETLDLS